ncbi:MAG: hypothetical protein U1E29_11390 [Coriobacteriia bacterium]|nr:hypothetical protein [Coriobacteriia bacterium]
MRRSFAADWAVALACTVLILAAYLVLRAVLGSPGLPWSETVLTALSAVRSLAAIMAAVGLSALGVWLARHMGWRRPWFSGVVVGAGAATLALEVVARFPV